MSINIKGVKLAKTPFWAIDLSKILNRHLKEDGRIPDNTVRFFVCENDDGKPEVSVARRELTLSDEQYRAYYAIACDIFEKCKDQAVTELNGK